MANSMSDKERIWLEEFNKYVAEEKILSGYFDVNLYTKEMLHSLGGIYLGCILNDMAINALQFLGDLGILMIDIDKLDGDSDLNLLHNMLKIINGFGRKIYIELCIRNYSYNEIKDCGVLKKCYENLNIRFILLDEEINDKSNTIEKMVKKNKDYIDCSYEINFNLGVEENKNVRKRMRG